MTSLGRKVMASPTFALSLGGALVDLSAGYASEGLEASLAPMLHRNQIGSFHADYENRDATPKHPPRSAFKAGVNMRSLGLNGMDLSGLNLRGASFESCKLTNVNLKGSDLIGANIAGADLRGAQLEGAKLDDVFWQHTICPDGAVLKRGALATACKPL